MDPDTKFPPNMPKAGSSPPTEAPYNITISETDPVQMEQSVNNISLICIKYNVCMY